MSLPKSIAKSNKNLATISSATSKPDGQTDKPLHSLVVPAYNEAAVVGNNLGLLCECMKALAEKYRWELIFVNDGSTDETGSLVEAFAETRDNMLVLHHPRNLG